MNADCYTAEPPWCIVSTANSIAFSLSAQQGIKVSDTFYQTSFQRNHLPLQNVISRGKKKTITEAFSWKHASKREISTHVNKNGNFLKMGALKALTYGIYAINKLPRQLPRSSDVCVYSGGRMPLTRPVPPTSAVSYPYKSCTNIRKIVNNSVKQLKNQSWVPFRAILGYIASVFMSMPSVFRK